jgi:hypothetical protein
VALVIPAAVEEHRGLFDHRAGPRLRNRHRLCRMKPARSSLLLS